MKSRSFYAFVLLTFLLGSCRPDHKSAGINNETSITGSSRTGDSSVSLSDPATCAQYHRKHCDPGAGEGWLYNTQSRSALFAQGSTSKVRCIIYKGMDYRMSVCGDKNIKIRFRLYDERSGELLYDNTTADGANVFEFSSTSTRPLTVEITPTSAPAGADTFCVGFLVCHKPTEK